MFLPPHSHALTPLTHTPCTHTRIYTTHLHTHTHLHHTLTHTHSHTDTYMHTHAHTHTVSSVDPSELMTVLEATNTRSLFLDDLSELQSFLTQRVEEYSRHDDQLHLDLVREAALLVYILMHVGGRSPLPSPLRTLHLLEIPVYCILLPLFPLPSQQITTLAVV